MGKLEEELETINKRAIQMALSIHEDSSLRPAFAEEARFLKRRLLDIADEVGQIDPVAHQEWFHRISESLLDFDFVVTETGITSLRLGDIVQWGK